jgi:hypothetical protein
MKPENVLIGFASICLIGIQNIANSQLLPLTNFEHILIDDAHIKWGDFDDPEWLRYFGLDFTDINQDGYADIVAGREVYVNPRGKMDGEWTKFVLPVNADGILCFDVDGDAYADIIAQALPKIYWFEAETMIGDTWRMVEIGTVPATSHVNSQGFEHADFIKGGKSEFVIAGDGDVYMFEVPADPEKGNWPLKLVGKNTSDEGIGYGDIDGDGDLDIACGRRPENQPEPLIVVWFENPGSFEAEWNDTEIGTTNHPADRVEIADLDGDARADVIVAEERWPGLEPDGNLFWYQQPDDPESGDWARHRIVTQYSMNNLDIADMDKDGDTDLITSEHKGSRLEVQLWENNGKGEFSKILLDAGKESHLGMQLYDMEGDGDLDIIAIGWDQYQKVHLWRNDALFDNQVNWKRYSSENGDIPEPNSGNQQTATALLDIDKDGIMDFVITERTTAPSVVWYKKNGSRWDRYIIDADPLRIEAGSAVHDIDGDGDQDIVFAGDSRNNEVWWWENPYPDLNPEQPWKRYNIKKSGPNKHHDQMFGDFDGDGEQELVFWNQGAGILYMTEVPADPKTVDEWDFEPIYSYSNDSEMDPVIGSENYPGWQSINEHEGFTKIDMDGDGLEDIVGGGRWFKYHNGVFIENIIDASYTFTRSAAGQFIEGGRPEVILVVGDGLGPMYMYHWQERESPKGTGTWKKEMIIPEVDNGHTIDVIDFNGDGHVDLFSAEMRFGEGNPDSKMRILLGDGKGHFTDYYIATGYGVHEGKIADLDGDGDYDILAKPYTWKAPRIDVWINEGGD